MGERPLAASNFAFPMHYENLLRANRETLALTQGEVGHLLGLSDDAIGNYENATRSPGLQTALGLELIFGRPLSQLFPDTRCAVAERMTHLLARFSIEVERETGVDGAVRQQFVASLGQRLINATSGA